MKGAGEGNIVKLINIMHKSNRPQAVLRPPPPRAIVSGRASLPRDGSKSTYIPGPNPIRSLRLYLHDYD